MFFNRTGPPISAMRVHRILLIQFESVSETLYSLPVLIALRMRYPHAQIAWLTDEKSVSVLKGHWAVDRLIVAKPQWVTSWTDTVALRKRLLNFAPEVTVDLQSRFRSSFAAWISGAKHRVGFSGPPCCGYNLWLNNHEVALTEKRASVERNLHLLEPFGVAGCSLAFDIPFSEMDRIIARDVLLRSGLRGNYAVIGLGEKGDWEFWSKERFAALSDYLLQQWNLPTLVVWSDPQSWKFAEEIVQCTNRSAVLSAPVNLSEMTELARSATFFVAPESSMLHLAATVETPCLGLRSPSDAPHAGLYGEYSRYVEVFDSSEETEKTVHAACDEILSQLIPSISFETRIETRRQETSHQSRIRAA